MDTDRACAPGESRSVGFALDPEGRVVSLVPRRSIELRGRVRVETFIFFQGECGGGGGGGGGGRCDRVHRPSVCNGCETRRGNAMVRSHCRLYSSRGKAGDTDEGRAKKACNSRRDEATDDLGDRDGSAPVQRRVPSRCSRPSDWRRCCEQRRVSNLPATGRELGETFRAPERQF